MATEKDKQTGFGQTNFFYSYLFSIPLSLQLISFFFFFNLPSFSTRSLTMPTLTATVLLSLIHYSYNYSATSTCSRAYLMILLYYIGLRFSCLPILQSYHSLFVNTSEIWSSYSSFIVWRFLSFCPFSIPLFVSYIFLFSYLHFSSLLISLMVFF